MTTASRSICEMYAEAERLYVRVLRIREQWLGDKSYVRTLQGLAGFYWGDTPYARALQALSEFYWEREKIEQLEQLHKRALAICEQTLGSEHISTAHSLYWLVVI